MNPLFAERLTWTLGLIEQRYVEHQDSSPERQERDAQTIFVGQLRVLNALKSILMLADELESGNHPELAMVGSLIVSMVDRSLLDAWEQVDVVSDLPEDLDVMVIDASGALWRKDSIDEWVCATPDATNMVFPVRIFECQEEYMVYGWNDEKVILED